MKVAILGAAGGIGQSLSLLLKTHLPPGFTLSLYDIAPMIPGVAVDLSHIPTDVLVKGFSGEVPTPALEGADVATLRETLDKLKDKLKSAAIVLASVNDGKVSLIAGVTADLTGKVKAGELVNMVAQQVGGKGGGRPDMAQAGGTDASALPAALASVAGWVGAKLG
mgnify:CR=1 FL=1